MEIQTVTVSYSRKLNHALYGGAQYESSDFFMSMSAEVESSENLIEVEKELRATCKSMVDDAVMDEIAGFQGGLTSDVFYTYIRDLVANRPIDAETYEAANGYQKSVLQAIKRGKQMKKRDEQKEDNE